MLLSYMGLFAAGAYIAVTDADRREAIHQEALRADRALDREAEIRERDLCMVVVNVNDNAKFRLRTERRRLRETKDYLRTIGPPVTELDRRVKSNLPRVKADVEVAKRNVDATKPPKTCAPYKHTSKG